MSSKNGDKSRYHRQRKTKIARRLRNEGLAKPQAAAKSKAAPASH